MKGDIERQRFDEFYECSDFVIIQDLSKPLRSRVREYENTDAFCEKYKTFKDMVEEFRRSALIKMPTSRMSVSK